MFWSYVSGRRQVLRTLTSGIGKTAVIYPAAALVACGMGTLGLGAIFFVREVFEASPRVVGCFAGTWLLCYTTGCFTLRPVACRLLPRYSVVLATMLMFASVLALACVRHFGVAFLLYAVYGLAASFFWPPMMGWLSANVEGRRLARSMGRFNLCWSGGLIVSPLLAGRLSEIDPRLPLVFGSVLFLATACLVAGAVLTLSGLSVDDGAHADERAVSTRDMGGTPARYPAWTGLFAAYAAQGAILTVFPISGPEDLGISKSAVGLLFLLRALTNTLGLGFFGRTSFWHFRGRQMMAGMLCFALTVGLMALAQSSVAVGFLLLLVGFWMAQAYSNSLFHGVSGAVSRAARMAIHEGLLAAGVIVGATLGGVIYQASSMAAVYGFCALVLVLAAAVQALIVLRHGDGL